MKPLKSFPNREIKLLFTDIDGTLTEHGKLPAVVYSHLEQLTETGLHVVPVTGRPAGWCELIARLWPIHGVIGENGAFYFRHDGTKMIRHFARPKKQRLLDRKKLRLIRAEVLQTVSGAAVASDQFCRLFDLAIDFKEDVAELKPSEIQSIVNVFKKHKATAKVSNIHVNGWFGSYDKLTMCKTYAEKELHWDQKTLVKNSAFIGDSPNDEPMFEFFNHSVGVKNIEPFLSQLRFRPNYCTPSEEGQGFVELAEILLKAKRI